jgi:Ni,Fe-hydrogenase III large subunit/NADH:ubiquinone oxidoreductase subunit C
MLLSDEIKTEIKHIVGRRRIREEALPKNRYNFTISNNSIEEVATYLKKSKGRLAYISVIDIGVDGFQVVYHYALDHLEKNLHFNFKAHIPRDDPQLPSLGKITEEAIWPEREMMDFTRVKFIGNPLLNHLWLPYEWPNPIEGASSKNDSNNDMKGVSVTQNLGEAKRSLILFGPYHPALIESVYWRLKVDGEEILDAEIKLGWNHRGIMKLFEDKSYRRALMISERICGICHISHTSAYTNAVENIAGIELPPRARYLKTLLNEFERIHSHLLWFAVAMDLIGFTTSFMLAFKLREEIMDIFEKISGHRRTTNCIQIGGIRFDISEADLLHIERRIQFMDKKTREMIEWATDHPVIRKRLEDIGVLPYETSIRLGGVGPTARGSDCKVDVRWSDPFAAYGEEWTTWDVIVENGGDCLSRTIVRLKELLVSYDLCYQCLEYLKKNQGSFYIEMDNMPSGEGLGKNEAPRGELLYYIISDGTNVPYSIRVRTPSYRNNSLLPEMLKGYSIADAPIIIGSIDPCMSCTDRLTRIEDVKTNKVTTLSLKEILRRCSDGRLSFQ